jgi:hypothetical protein
MIALPAGLGVLCKPSGTVAYLDQLSTTPRCCLSLRKKISTATVAIRIRRSSDNTEQDIGFSGNSLDTSAITSFVGSNSAYVTKFYDQTGNGFDAVQATAANQPRIVNAGTIDSQPVFDGSNDFLKITGLTNAGTAAGIYAKAKQVLTGSAAIFWESSTNYNSNSGAFVGYMNATNYGIGMSTSGGTRAITYGLGLSTAKQVTILYNRALTGSAETDVYVGGSSTSPLGNDASAECTGNFATYDVYFGSRGGASLFAALELESWVFYDANTSSLRTSIEALLA